MKSTWNQALSRSRKQGYGANNLVPKVSKSLIMHNNIGLSYKVYEETVAKFKFISLWWNKVVSNHLKSPQVAFLVNSPEVAMFFSANSVASSIYVCKVTTCFYSMSFHMDFNTGLFRRPTKSWSTHHTCIKVHVKRHWVELLETYCYYRSIIVEHYSGIFSVELTWSNT